MLAVRIEEELERQLAAVARRKGRSKSDLVREALRRYLDDDLWLSECRRQSRLATEAAAQDPIDDLLEAAAGEVKGWT